VKSAGRGDLKSLILNELQEQLRNLGGTLISRGSDRRLALQKARRHDRQNDEFTATVAQAAFGFVFTWQDRRHTSARCAGYDAEISFSFSRRKLIESVLIPASLALYGGRTDRRTICVSTQVGCAYGCKFCASGLEGFSRNLSANEIVDQLVAVEPATGEKIDDIVFMGMAEPLANLENGLRAIRIINAEWGLIGARHITISTSGLAPQIRKLGEERLQIRLAVSLHGATEEVRNQIMPINRRYNVETLLSTCDYYKAHKKQHLTFEYILIADVNDSDDQARLLSRHAHRLSAKVNLIRYNSVSGLPLARPSEKRQEKFLSMVRAEGILVTLRREKGHDIDAACGQLRLQTERETIAGK
jgi:23S rRNA (adenine2503-C2)-methyltransferase